MYGEALGLITSIKWVYELEFDLVDFELNAKSVVDNVINQQPNDSNLGDITHECKCLLAIIFRNSHVKFVRRQANEAAHALARVAPSYFSFHNFINIPTCIQNIMTNAKI